MPFGLFLYRALTALIAPALPLLLRRRLRAGKEHPARWRERLGFTDAARPPGPLIWLHGASVGEGLSLLPLVDALLAARPGLTILVTTGTVTSAELLEKRLPPVTARGGAFHQFVPADATGPISRFLDHWRPNLAIFVESEIWPNLLEGLRQRDIPAALLSARLSETSFRGWRHVPETVRRLFDGVAMVMAQDDEMADRLTALGIRDDGRLNLKIFGAPLAAEAGLVDATDSALGERPVFIAASTHPGEEEIVLDGFAGLERPEAFLILVPRHPDRGEAVAALARQRRFAVTRRAAGEPVDANADVYVADTLGELGSWFELSGARAAFVGGSLMPGPGGHNPLEPIRQGLPVITGPHIDNWLGVYALVTDAVLTVENEQQLQSAFGKILDDPHQASARARRALDAVRASEGELQSVASQLLALVEARP